MALGVRMLRAMPPRTSTQRSARGKTGRTRHRSRGVNSMHPKACVAASRSSWFNVQRLLAQAILMIAFVSPAWGQRVKFGSLVVFRYSKDKVIMAAESRRVDKTGQYDDECKIFVLSDKVIFGFTGISNVSGIGPLPNFDALEDARAAVRHATTTLSGTGLARNAARFWAGKMKQHMQNWPMGDLINVIRVMGGEPGLACGVFAASEPGGDISVYLARITVTYRPPQGIAIADEVDAGPRGNSVNTGVCGRDEIVREFVTGETERAREEGKRWFEWRKKCPQDADAKIASRLVQLTIELDHSGLVGGPIDSIELRRGGTPHWIQRKRQCPQD